MSHDEDLVYIRSYTTGIFWILATIFEPIGPMSYIAQSLIDVMVSRRRIDQVRDRVQESKTSDSTSTFVAILQDEVPTKKLTHAP